MNPGHNCLGLPGGGWGAPCVRREGGVMDICRAVTAAFFYVFVAVSS